jgi:hypothetical protein
MYEVYINATGCLNIMGYIVRSLLIIEHMTY